MGPTSYTCLLYRLVICLSSFFLPNKAMELAQKSCRTCYRALFDQFFLWCIVIPGQSTSHDLLFPYQYGHHLLGSAVSGLWNGSTACASCGSATATTGTSHYSPNSLSCWTRSHQSATEANSASAIPPQSRMKTAFFKKFR
jgi:hypothetical protein